MSRTKRLSKSKTGFRTTIFIPNEYAAKVHAMKQRGINLSRLFRKAVDRYWRKQEQIAQTRDWQI